MTTGTAFTRLVGCRVPLQLAGMGGGISDVGLACAVSNAGGLGMLGVGGLPAPLVVQLIDETSGATTGAFGVNFLMPFLDRDAVAAASGRCRVVEFFYADPDPSVVEIARSGGSLAAWQVGSADEARAAVDAGCDFVIAQGHEAGGHVRATGALDIVLGEVLDAVSVPVVASGGIGTAADVKRCIDAGAAGVRIGTRFLAATESIAHPDYIDALLGSSAEDTVLTEAFSVGWPDAPHRVLRSCVDAAEAASEENVGVASMGGAEMPVPRFASLPPTKDTTGNIAAMALYAGTSVGAVSKRQPAAEIVAELCGEI